MGLSKENAIKQIEATESEEFVVRTAAEESTYLSNYLDAEVEKKIGPKIAEAHSFYDKDIKETLGLEKKDGEKTYDFLKGILVDLKSKADESEGLKTKITELQKGNKGDESLRKELDDYKEKHSKALSDWEEERTGLNTQFKSQRILSKIDAAVGGMKFKKAIPEEAVKAYLSTIKDELVKMAEFDGDKLIFKNDKGVMRHDKTLIPMTEGEILSERLSDFLDTEKKTGTGTKLETNKSDGKTIISIPDTVTTKGELSEYLKKEILSVFPEKGYTKGTVGNSKEYIQAYAELGKDLPIN